MCRRTRTDSVRLSTWLSSFFCLYRNVLLQSIEPRLPELPVLLKPGAGGSQCPRTQTANPLPSLDFAHDEPCSLEHHHVLRDCVERYWKWLCDLADRGRPVRQHLNNCASRRVCHRRKHPAELIA